MADHLFLKPAEGLHVLDPVTKQPLPPEGKRVLDGTYWQRRLRDGDVVEIGPQAAAEGASPSSPESRRKPK